MNKAGKHVISYGYIAYGGAFFMMLLGVAWQTAAKSTLAMLVLCVPACIPILLFGANFIFSKLYVKKINDTPVADMQGYMLRHRDEAEKTSRELLKKLQKIRRVTGLYTVFLWLFAACAACLGGMLYAVASRVACCFCLFYAGTIFYVIYTRIPRKESSVLKDGAPILPRDEYPTIHDLASRAARNTGCRKEIEILIDIDCNAGILEDATHYYIQLGIILLAVLSQEELYSIFLHEFSHCSPKNQKENRETRYAEWISSDQHHSTWFLRIANLFSAFDLVYLFHHMTYHYATSVFQETEADRDMAKFCSPATAGSSLLKTGYHTRYLWESNVKNETPYYVTETPNPRHLRNEVEKFKNAIALRHEAWDAMIEKEILPNNASHPTLTMRLNTLGLQKIEMVEDESNEDYKREVQTALDFADKKFAECQNTYEQDRKEYYLEPLRRIAEWEEEGMPLRAEQYPDLVSDLMQIGRNEDAEALCDRAMAELDENAALYAYYIKGCALIHRYEEKGAEYLFHAIEKNHNFLEDGLHQIGQFYCMMGMEAELLEYRKRAQQFAQKNKDEYSETAFLSPKDKLSCDDMPEEMRNEILAYIRSVDEDIIQKIYLVRKTVNETFFTSAFVIHFYGGTDAKRSEIMHKIFCYLDTYPKEWQFSLFDYFDCPDINFKKIEGSLVYHKTENKGEKQ
ncbi:MAG: M48 family metallopeptidase [Clostridia bacterium]|nr:M48 family metallopeptidase [Clostridia bacterium]